MKRLLLIVPLVFLLTGCTQNNAPTEKAVEQPTSSSSATKGNTQMTLTRIDKSESTTKKMATIQLQSGGKVVLALYPELAPNFVENFISKAKSGYYDGLVFHRVEGWVVQGGDPTGTGSGGGSLGAEYNNRTFKVGSVGVARAGDPNINNDSQFFITTKDSNFLDKNYTNFGDVTSGMDQVLNIKIGDKIKTITVE